MPELGAAPQGAADGWVQAWKRFWFAPVDPLPLGVFRACFCFALTYFYLARQFDYQFLFSDDGALPYRMLTSNADSIFPIAWREFATDASVGRWIHAVFLTGLVGLGLGWIGRRAAWIVFLLHLVFLDRNPMVVYGPDSVATFWLGYLCLTRANQAFAWTPWPLSKRSDAANAVREDPLTTVGVRLIQIQLCIVYAYSGLEKARGLPWWQGAAIWQTLSNGQLVTLDLSFLAYVPSLVAAITIVTMLWEIYFPFLVWNRTLRPYCLVFGVILHVGIGGVMHLPFFAAFMTIPYLLFLGSRREGCSD